MSVGNGQNCVCVVDCVQWVGYGYVHGRTLCIHVQIMLDRAVAVYQVGLQVVDRTVCVCIYIHQLGSCMQQVGLCLCMCAQGRTLYVCLLGSTAPMCMYSTGPQVCVYTRQDCVCTRQECMYACIYQTGLCVYCECTSQYNVYSGQDSVCVQIRIGNCVHAYTRQACRLLQEAQSCSEVNYQGGCAMASCWSQPTFHSRDLLSMEPEKGQHWQGHSCSLNALAALLQIQSVLF